MEQSRFQIGSAGVAERAQEFVPGQPGKYDIYLAPHSDDICFSLGHFTRQRNAGMLLTVFSVTGYVAGANTFDRAHIRPVTRLRMSEDAAFADACGLMPDWLGFPDAFAREQPSFNAAPAEALAAQISDVVVRAILAPTVGRLPQPRPWLFCPAGIGGHVDHVALMLLVLSKANVLTQHYRIAFYEDLHYASKRDVRSAGIERLAAAAAGRLLERRTIRLSGEDSLTQKMDLVQFYRSQLTPRISSIDSYVTASEPGDEPHEAVWVLQDDTHQRPG